MSGEQLGVGVIGLGFMGRTHVRAYGAARAAGLPCRVVAVCEQDGATRAAALGKTVDAGARGNLAVEGGDGAPLVDAATVHACADPIEIAADPAVDMVSICTPTDTHTDLAAMMLVAGKHVLVEKPVALEAAGVRELEEIAADCGRLCMPAMCMRFWPGWDWLKDRVADGSLGGVRSAVFRRVGSRPAWSRAFYGDDARTGGALFDLHIHDADIVCWLFGPPDSVTSSGDVSHITTAYRYRRGPAHVIAEGAWLSNAGLPFRMRFTVEFERAVADWDLSRPPAERLVLAQGGHAATVPLVGDAGYDPEVRHFVEVVASFGDASTEEIRLGATLAEAAVVTELLLAERDSAEQGREVSTHHLQTAGPPRSPPARPVS
jgi:predicted dehydrogenase